MSVELTDLQKRLCNELQKGLPICERPFAQVAQVLGVSEDEVLEQTSRLKADQVIRRFSAVVNHRALGKASTLVTAHVPEIKLDKVGPAVSALEGVSHNYLRDHHYNLWFTLQAPSEQQLDAILADLSRRFGTPFHSLPVIHAFKLEVRFDLLNDDPLAKVPVEPPADPVDAQLSQIEKRVLVGLQQTVSPVARPFDHLAGDDLSIQDALAAADRLVESGVVRRIATVLNYRKLGYTANILFAAEVPAESIVRAGGDLARYAAVSHCYERRTFDGWPYNLFGMTHGRTTDDVRRVTAEFTANAPVISHQLLPTKAELKKKPVKHNLM